MIVPQNPAPYPPKYLQSPVAQNMFQALTLNTGDRGYDRTGGIGPQLEQGRGNISNGGVAYNGPIPIHTTYLPGYGPGEPNYAGPPTQKPSWPFYYPEQGEPLFTGPKPYEPGTIAPEWAVPPGFSEPVTPSIYPATWRGAAFGGQGRLTASPYAPWRPGETSLPPPFIPPSLPVGPGEGPKPPTQPEPIPTGPVTMPGIPRTTYIHPAMPGRPGFASEDPLTQEELDFLNQKKGLSGRGEIYLPEGGGFGPRKGPQPEPLPVSMPFSDPNWHPVFGPVGPTGEPLWKPTFTTPVGGGPGVGMSFIPPTPSLPPTPDSGIPPGPGRKGGEVYLPEGGGFGPRKGPQPKPTWSQIGTTPKTTSTIKWM